MPLLLVAHYESVRKAIDLSLDATALPDAVIALDLYAGAAERAILARDPQALSRSDEALARVTLAAVLWCASLLAPALPQITSQANGNDRFTRSVADPTALAADLRARAEGEIAAVLTPETSSPHRPPVFALASGRRGR